MKSKLLVCCALLISAVVVSAIPWSADAHRHSAPLIKAGKLTEAREFLDTIEGVSGTVAIFRAWADHVDEAVDTSTTAKLKAVVEGYNSAQGFTGVQLKNATDYAMLWIYIHGVADYDAGLAYFNTLENPSAGCVARAVVALYQQGKADEAVSLAVAHKRWYEAFRYSSLKKDKVKTFEYGKKLLLSAYQKPKIVKLVLDAVGGFNYDDTEITIDDQILFLFNFDGKYSRFLVEERNLPEAEKVWEPIIAGVRVTVERLQAKKKLLNK